MRSILLALFTFGIIITIHELGHFIMAKLFHVQVNEFSFGFGPKIISKKIKSTVYSIRLLLFGGYVAMEDENSTDNSEISEGSFQSKSPLQQLIILVAGALMNVLLGFFVLLFLTNQFDLLGTNIIANVPEDSAVFEILQSGDKITSINNVKTRTYNDVVTQLVRDDDLVFDIEIKRDAELLSKTVSFDFTVDEFGNKSMIFDLQFYGNDRTFFNSIPYAFNWSTSMVKQVLYSLQDIIKGKYGVNELSGPIGTISYISETSKMGIKTFLNLVAFITINVGVFNLLPIPGLDGGRIIIILLQLVLGYPIPKKYENYINLVGLLLMFGLIIYVSYNDLTNLLR